MNSEQILNKIASILSSGKSSRDQINAIAELIIDADAESDAELNAVEPSGSNYVWDDPMVVEACKEGRSAHDIQLLICPKCNKVSYWNEGSHFTCRFCSTFFEVSSEMADEAVSLADRGDESYPITDAK